MNKSIKTLLTVIAIASISACTRIETGEVGVRVNASKEIQGTELLPGTWNQTLIGDVLTFPIRDISVNIENKTPMTADNAALSDFDITVVYSINPQSVAELYTKKSRGFHFYDEKTKDTLLMYRYMETLVNNAIYKSVREYKALEIADSRAVIEKKVLDYVTEQLKTEKLDTSIMLTVVQVRNIQPNKEILDSAVRVVKATNDLAVKETEVQIAKKEAERMAALAQNGNQSIQYMAAQANLLVAQAIANGKVQTIVVPMDFKGQVVIK